MLKDKLHEGIVNLSLDKVESNVRMGPNTHGPGDFEEILLVEKIALGDEGVKAEIAKLQLPEGTAIVSDPWIYGTRTFACHIITSSSHSVQAPTVLMTIDGCTSASST